MTSAEADKITATFTATAEALSALARHLEQLQERLATLASLSGDIVEVLGRHDRQIEAIGDREDRRDSALFALARDIDANFRRADVRLRLLAMQMPPVASQPA